MPPKRSLSSGRTVTLGMSRDQCNDLRHVTAPLLAREKFLFRFPPSSPWLPSSVQPTVSLPR
jgi:hypothetical protein